MKYIDTLDIAGKTLLFRVDFNVPLDGVVITDDNRIEASLPTLRYAQEKGAKIIVCAHLGKPGGKVVPALSLAPVAARLGEMMGCPVGLAPSCIGKETEEMAASLKDGEILMLENLRFHKREIAKTSEERTGFGEALASLADVYVNDAFGVAHRTNASVVDVPKYTAECCAGFLMKKEFEYLSQAVANSTRPYAVVSGGAKISTKLAVLEHLIDKVDDMIIGGAMANTFVLAQGYGVGNSLVESGLVDEALKIMSMAKEEGTNLHLPVDFVYAARHDAEKAAGICAYNAIPDGMMALDVGPETTKNFCEVLKKSGSVVWNGPMGLFENPAFATASLAVCETLAGLDETLTIVGGGDTDAIVHHAEMTDKFSFISTGGGSFLEFLEGKELPAFAALQECAKK